MVTIHCVHNSCCPHSKARKAERARVLSLVRENGKELELLSDELRNDREVVLAAVRQSGSVLEYWYASEALKGDREVVLVVAQSNWMALQHASAKVRSES
jgi:hypothetical protein